MQLFSVMINITESSVTSFPSKSLLPRADTHFGASTCTIRCLPPPLVTIALPRFSWYWFSLRSRCSLVISATRRGRSENSSVGFTKQTVTVKKQPLSLQAYMFSYLYPSLSFLFWPSCWALLSQRRIPRDVSLKCAAFISRVMNSLSKTLIYFSFKTAWIDNTHPRWGWSRSSNATSLGLRTRMEPRASMNTPGLTCCHLPFPQKDTGAVRLLRARDSLLFPVTLK